MYSAKLKINKTIFKGILDIGAIKCTQNEILKEQEKHIGVVKLFDEIRKDNNTYMSIFILEIIVRHNDISKEDFLNIFLEYSRTNNEDLTREIYRFFNELFEKAMPKNEEKEESEFEDIPDFREKNEDWDFPTMEYIWKSVLNRQDDFWGVTPKNYFEQYDLYNKAHGKEIDVHIESI